MYRSSFEYDIGRNRARRDARACLPDSLEASCGMRFGVFELCGDRATDRMAYN